jgi:FkbM family methyltransferase
MLLNNLLALFNLRVTKKSTYDSLLKSEFDYADCKQQLDILLSSPQLNRLVNSQSQMQLRQDIFVLSTLAFKERGYFVEFGAASGRELSNTYLLESEFGWHGVIAEPAKCWHESISKNRKCLFDKRCVWKESNRKILFNESSVGELSTIDSFALADIHKSFRGTEGKTYEVETVSLLDLLITHGAPSVVDYLSIDTEGSEYEILSAFNFDLYQFRVITCEHNMGDTREKIFDLLTSKGYSRLYPELSKCDDWYVKII